MTSQGRACPVNVGVSPPKCPKRSGLRVHTHTHTHTQTDRQTDRRWVSEYLHNFVTVIFQ